MSYITGHSGKEKNSTIMAADFHGHRGMEPYILIKWLYDVSEMIFVARERGKTSVGVRWDHRPPPKTTSNNCIRLLLHFRCMVLLSVSIQSKAGRMLLRELNDNIEETNSTA